MYSFKNRKADFINRKKLTVLNVKRNNNGEIVEIIANVTRDEGTKYEVGTLLNAETFKEIFEYFSHGIDYLCKDFYSAENDLNINWVQDLNILQTKTLRIDLNRKFYGKLTSYNELYLSGSVTNNSDHINVKINETAGLNNTTGTSSRQLPFYVELYLDEDFKKYVTRIKGTVSYFNVSEAPLD